MCDGVGGITAEVDEADVPMDDGNDCTGEVCSGGAPEHPPHALGTSCSQDGGTACDGAGACVDLVLGETCGDASQCVSGFCVDGVCCDAACDTTCVACIASQTGSAAGTCAPVVVETDPQDECSSSSATSCGTTGICNGSAQAPGCALFPAGTACAPTTCTAGMLTEASSCDGAGTCIAGQTTPCPSAACNAAGTACECSCPVTQPCDAANGCRGSQVFGYKHQEYNDPDLPVTAPISYPVRLAPNALGDLVSGMALLRECSSLNPNQCPPNSFVYVDRYGGYQKAFTNWLPDASADVAIDDLGNVVLVVRIAVPTLTIGSTTVTGNVAGASDLLMVKLDPQGDYLWHKVFGDSTPNVGPIISYRVAISGAGEITLAGAMRRTVDFGGGPLAKVGNDNDAFVARFDADGNHVWSARYGDNGGVEQSVRGVAFDASGDVIAFGQFSGSFDWGAGPITSAGSSDVFLLKLDGLTGALTWGYRFGGAGPEQALSVATDTTNAIVLTGDGTTNFGGGPVSGPYLVKLDPSATLLWRKDLPSAAVAATEHVTGAVAIAAACLPQGASTDLGGGAIACDTFPEHVIAKFDTNGNHFYSRKSFIGSPASLGPPRPDDVAFWGAGGVGAGMATTDSFGPWNYGVGMLGTGYSGGMVAGYGP